MECIDIGLFELKVMGHVKNLNVLSVRFIVNSHITAEQILMRNSIFTFIIVCIYELFLVPLNKHIIFNVFFYPCKKINNALLSTTGMLPKQVADDLRQGKHAQAQSYSSATIFFR